MSDPNPKPRGNPNMRPGGPSLNPRGRPKRGDALAERVRAAVDPDELIATLKQLASNPGAKAEVRLKAIAELLDRGWGKAIATTEVDAKVDQRTEAVARVRTMSME